MVCRGQRGEPAGLSKRGWKSFCFSPSSAAPPTDFFRGASFDLCAVSTNSEHAGPSQKALDSLRTGWQQPNWPLLAAAGLDLHRFFSTSVSLFFFSKRRSSLLSLLPLSLVFFFEALTAAFFFLIIPRQRTSRGHATPLATALCLWCDSLRPSDGSESDGGASRCLSGGR